MMAGKFTITVGGNLANSDEVSVMGISFTSNYSLTRADIIRLSVKTSLYSNDNPGILDYNEYIGSISYTHRF